jgi:predicted phosphodiesterase
MKTSGLFTVHSFNIPIKFAQETQIIIFGDVHWDSPNHAHGKWQEDLDYFRSQKNAYFIGMGDYLDSTSTTERECLGDINKKMHETFRNDIQALQQAKIEKFAKEISFMKGRLIGLVNGNHYFEFQSGINADQKLADLLNAKYLGVCSLIRLCFMVTPRWSNTMDLFVHHGMGAARLVGGSLNRVIQMFEGVEADICIMGHDHKRAAVPSTPRLYLDNTSHDGLKVRQRETWAVRSGSYLAAYRDGEINYNVDSCRTPASLGHIEMRVKLTSNNLTVAGKCAAACGKSIVGGYHIDHIVPISKGGVNDNSNVQLLCPLCNWRKNDKDPILFMRERGFLL